MANKKRIKLDRTSLIPINNWSEADGLVREIGDFQLKINQAEHTAKDKIDEAKAELAEEIKPSQEYIKQYVRSLEAFAVSHREYFEKQKSLKLNFGILGWRRSTSISIKKTTLELIKKVFSRVRAKTLIRTKESVDKEALAKLTDEQLADVGARRVEKDVFFVEPELPEAVDYVE